MRHNEIKVVSFSGIDGAGKSTQIETLCQFVRSSGLRCKVVTFWDDVVALSRFRERASSIAFKGEQGVGAPDRPILRRDKNITAWYLTAARVFLYLLDAIRLCVVFSRNVDADYDFVVFDRYLYDELANLPLQRVVTRFFVRLLLALIPRPDVAFVLDAEPEAATLRKPEYPLDFVRRNREAYLRLSLIAGITVIPPSPIEEASRMIRDIVSEHCLVEDPELLDLGLASEGAETGNR